MSSNMREGGNDNPNGVPPSHGHLPPYGVIPPPCFPPFPPPLIVPPPFPPLLIVPPPFPNFSVPPPPMMVVEQVHRTTFYMNAGMGYTYPPPQFNVPPPLPASRVVEISEVPSVIEIEVPNDTDEILNHKSNMQVEPQPNAGMGYTHPPPQFNVPPPLPASRVVEISEVPSVIEIEVPNDTDEILNHKSNLQLEPLPVTGEGPTEVPSVPSCVQSASPEPQPGPSTRARKRLTLMKQPKLHHETDEILNHKSNLQLEPKPVTEEGPTEVPSVPSGVKRAFPETQPGPSTRARKRLTLMKEPQFHDETDEIPNHKSNLQLEPKPIVKKSMIDAENEEVILLSDESDNEMPNDNNQSSDSDDDLPDVDIPFKMENYYKEGDKNEDLYGICVVGLENLYPWTEVVQVEPCYHANACNEHAVEWMGKSSTCYYCTEPYEKADVIPYWSRRFSSN